MFHKPAHRDTVTPPGQVRNPIPGNAPAPVPQQPATPDIYTLIRFEAGELSSEEAIAFIQDGIDTGWVWKLQGFYGRTAQSLINAGHCTARCVRH